MSTPGVKVFAPSVAAVLPRLACLDGEVVALANAVIPVTDEGLLRGDGVFEVIRIYAGRPFALPEHLRRLADSAANLRLALEVQAVRQDVQALLAQARPDDALMRIVVTRGGRRIVLLEELPDLGPSISMGYVTYAPTRILDGVKSLSYGANMLASRLARERGFDEALLVTPHGRVLEAPTASFFWVREGHVLTPPLADHLLDSITRRLVIATVGAREVITTPADVSEADEAFLASTVREVMPIDAVENRRLPADRPVTEAAAREVSRRIQRELENG